MAEKWTPGMEMENKTNEIVNTALCECVCVWKQLAKVFPRIRSLSCDSADHRDTFFYTTTGWF